MNKKMWLTVLVIGFLLVIASVMIAFALAGSANIIGGASWSTFSLYFEKNAWLALVGACLMIGSAIGLIAHRK